MTLDQVMLSAVRHYLGGRIGGASAAHSEMHSTGRSLNAEIDSSKKLFLDDLKDMLQDPVPILYSHQEDYHLTGDDRQFLDSLYHDAEKGNWRNSEEIEKIKSALDKYAPITGIGKSI